VDSYRVIYKRHAIERMKQRKIREETVECALSSGETIKVYADDTPYPSELILYWDGLRPLHIVVATDFVDRVKYIVTVYDPYQNEWIGDFRRKKP